MIAGEIRPCRPEESEDILEVVNEAASAYRGVIPPDRWHEPYMSREELAREMESGVRFRGFYSEGRLLGVMGLQDVLDVALIRHAYVRTPMRRRGIGGRLLAALLAETDRRVLVGTWAAATWAVDFYRRHGFTQVPPDEKDRLLRRYWRIPERQIETSVVLVREAGA